MKTLADIMAILVRPFAAAEVKSRPGRGGQKFSYVDARVVAQRLDEALTPAGWSFQVRVTDAASAVVRGILSVTLPNPDGSGTILVCREDFGYPNNPDNPEDEALKSAASDALKRCAVQLGVGRHLYGVFAPAPSIAPLPVAKAAAFRSTDTAEEIDDLIRVNGLLTELGHGADLDAWLAKSGATSWADVEPATIHTLLEKARAKWERVVDEAVA